MAILETILFSGPTSCGIAGAIGGNFAARDMKIESNIRKYALFAGPIAYTAASIGMCSYGLAKALDSLFAVESHDILQNAIRDGSIAGFAGAVVMGVAYAASYAISREASHWKRV